MLMGPATSSPTLVTAGSCQLCESQSLVHTSVPGAHHSKASVSASACSTPPLLPPTPALKYSVMFPNPFVPQGKRRPERLRNLLFQLRPWFRHPVAATFQLCEPASLPRPSRPGQPPSVVGIPTLVHASKQQLTRILMDRSPFSCLV